MTLSSGTDDFIMKINVSATMYHVVTMAYHGIKKPWYYNGDKRDHMAFQIVQNWSNAT